MKVCVITPSYNPGRYILPCLESVHAQHAVVSRHIVADGGSTDGTVEVLRQFQHRNPRFEWRSEPDRGQADALNKALALVDTEYFGWLNADDAYCPSGLERLIAAARALRGATPAIIYGDYQWIDEHGNVLKSRRQPTFNYWDCLHYYLTVQNAAAIFHTETVRQRGGFDESLQFAMDYDLVVRVANPCIPVHVAEYVGQFRIHEASKTSRIQLVCDAETAGIRRKYSPCSPAFHSFLRLLSKIRVTIRMAREGCLRCRLTSAEF